MQRLKDTSPQIMVSEPLELFFHDRVNGPIIADFAFETIAKSLKLKVKKITQDCYTIGYFTSSSKIDYSNEDLNSKFQQGLNMMRLFINDKEKILSEPVECDKIPIQMVELGLLSLDIFKG